MEGQITLAIVFIEFQFIGFFSLRKLIKLSFECRYVVRAKAGKKQSLKDASGRFAHSAGASLRRYNELSLKKVTVPGRTVGKYS